ncbi:MAG: HEAT repeat domain-containing protein [Methanospirillum sp.]|nr:HEAT repeat domain-containing protein [Methanospirillum sp.]
MREQESRSRAAPALRAGPGGDAEIDYLVGLLTGGEVGDRWKAAQALGRIRDPAGLEALVGALRDEDRHVQTRAIWALGSIGDPRALPHLRRRYGEVDEFQQGLIREAQDRIRERMYRPE